MEFLIELLKVVIIGIVEGITEWLPVSSTGHMILVEEFLHLNVTAEFQEMFNVVIQLGAIMAVVVLYFKKLWPFQRKVKGFQGWIKRDVWDLWMKVIIAVIPAAVIGIPLDDWFTEHFHNYQVVALMLIIYGVLFIVIENYNKHRTPAITDFSQMSWKMALAIGAFQVLSLIPGTSRSGSTILGALLL
ncbi:MAG: undecaprenyl-diphosphate phosphatase, partial [Peptococcaceae bacterium]|nr:undecaprenyl-diphosphate phosphatase [Peptococcaceae bacterium]